MKLANKLVDLRKRNGLSQDDVANHLGVSRQSISKWEGELSIPEIDKLISLSKLFNVSLDTLLKDEIELEDEVIDKDLILNEEFVDTYIKKKKLFGILDGIATVLMILSPIALIILSTLQVYNNLALSESMAGMIGLVVLIIFVGVGVALYIYAYFLIKDYRERLKSEYSVSCGLKYKLVEKKKNYENTYLLKTILGCLFCILSVIQLFIGTALENELAIIIGLSITLGIVSIGVYFFIESNSYRNGILMFIDKSFNNNSKENKVESIVQSCLWLLTVCLYLAISFITKKWELTWIIFVIVGFLSAIVGTIFSGVKKKD